MLEFQKCHNGQWTSIPGRSSSAFSKMAQRYFFFGRSHYKARNTYWGERPSTVDLLVLSGSDQMFLYWKYFFYSFTKSYLNEEVNCTEPSPSVSVHCIKYQHNSNAYYGFTYNYFTCKNNAFSSIFNLHLIIYFLLL